MALAKLRFFFSYRQTVDKSSTSPSNYSAISIDSIHNIRCTKAQYIYLSTLDHALGPVYMVSVTRDSPPPETTLPSVYMRIA